jgi:hypothetical protein
MTDDLKTEHAHFHSTQEPDASWAHPAPCACGVIFADSTVTVRNDDVRAVLSAFTGMPDPAEAIDEARERLLDAIRAAVTEPADA